MLKFPKYPHIDNLYQVPEILNEECVIQEKIHGSNIRIMYDKESNFVVGSRQNIIYHNNKLTGSLFGATEYLLKIGLDEKLKNLPQYEGFVFYGEFYGDGIQGGVKYCNGKQLRLFDIKDANGNMLNYDRVISIAKELNIDTVPILYIGKINIELLNALREGNSIVAQENGIDASNKTIREGVVIKPIVMRMTDFGEWLMAKHKSDKWAENVK